MPDWQRTPWLANIETAITLVVVALIFGPINICRAIFEEPDRER